MDIQILKDGVNIDTIGWNLTQHRDNTDTLKGTENALLKAIQQSDQLCRVFLVENSRLSSG
jgi:hypothetical protein